MQQKRRKPPRLDCSKPEDAHKLQEGPCSCARADNSMRTKTSNLGRGTAREQRGQHGQASIHHYVPLIQDAHGRTTPKSPRSMQTRDIPTLCAVLLRVAGAACNLLATLEAAPVQQHQQLGSVSLHGIRNNPNTPNSFPRRPKRPMFFSVPAFRRRIL